MIVLSKTTSDTAGTVQLEIDHDKSDLRTYSRRLVRTKTLDGGVVISDSGFSDGDRTLRIVALNVGGALAAALETMHQNNTIIGLSMAGGFYSAAIKTLSIKDGGAVLAVFLKSKLS
ncbi:MAG: hypothetical protein JRJ85_17695 [Deltaproteobacteria bacterium]|nr:hypothetical protein [Deltaproteobacteria bacterium]